MKHLADVHCITASASMFAPCRRLPVILLFIGWLGWSFAAISTASGQQTAAGDEQPVAGPNLVENASLEQLEAGQPQHWKPTTWSGVPIFETDDDTAHSGRRSVKISSVEGADASWSFTAKLKPHTDYQLSAWIKTEDIGEGGLGALLNLHQLQMEGKTEALRGTNDWTQVSSEFNTGPHSTLLVNLLYGGWGRATGTAWFDDVQLVELKPPMPSMTEQQALQLFETRVLPILKENCFECHGGGEKIRAEFVLTNRDDLIKGGESGPAIDLESPGDSLLLEAINYESYEMPPDGRLSDNDIEAMTKWVMMGAPWKGEGLKPRMESHASEPAVNEENKLWWSYQPVTRPPVPDIDDPWIRNEIDQFILRGLRDKGLQPNPAADRRALIRRAYYDLIGLPPTPVEVEAFVNDPSDKAYEQLIDHLLASPHYGEKWGRHWLDLVRYAESNSYERDGTKPFVWRYRDYVIRSFNDDKPYDEFIIEQLAGDEMEEVTADRIIATGYYRLGKWDDEPVDHNQAWFDDMDDVLATTGQAMLGMTINCARCHNHKIDPIPQEDYYRMLAFFRNVRRYGVRAHETVVNASVRVIAPPEVQLRHREQTQAHQEALQANKQALEAIEAIVKKDFIPVEHEEFKHEMNRVPLVKKRAGGVITQVQADQYETLFAEMKRLRREKPAALEAALCVKEHGDTAPDTFVMIRGNAHAAGEQVQPGFPSILSPPEPHIEAPAHGESTGRRMALARWIASGDNPLTSRVMVNRVWQHHFGRGIVRSSSDFGFQGNLPTHPELLDWLANELVDGGWTLKRLHKLIMMSAAYRMSSADNPDAYAADPLNDSIWRFDMRRLTAEEIRDSILAVNASLNKEKMFGPSIYPIIPAEVLHGQSRPGENWGKSSPQDLARRSIYIHIKRSLTVPLLASFDAADPDSPCPVRFNTVQPTQALAMINSEFLNRQAKVFAEYLQSMAPDDLRMQIKSAIYRVTQRPPTEKEIARGLEFIETMKADELDQQQALQHFCLVALNLNEFLYLD